MSLVGVSERIRKRKTRIRWMILLRETGDGGVGVIKISGGSFCRSHSRRKKKKTINEFLRGCLIYRHRANWTLVTILITSASYFVQETANSLVRRDHVARGKKLKRFVPKVINARVCVRFFNARRFNYHRGESNLTILYDYYFAH